MSSRARIPTATVSFRVELPPGRYIVDPDDGGKSLANGDGRVTVREGSFARVDLTHYTGLL